MTTSQAAALGELENLHKKRGFIKAALTRFNRYLEKLKEPSVTELTERVSKFQCLLEQFEETQQLIELCQPCDNEREDKERETFENEYFRLLAAAKDIISPPNRTGSSPSTVSVASEKVIATTNAKLPSLSLPSFHGDCKQWLSFKNGFNALVNSEININNITKFHYLLSCLKSDSGKCLEALEVTDGNYSIAWEILEKRYANLNLIKREHMRALFEYTPIQKESYKSLRKFHDDISQHLRALESLGDPVKQWDRPMIYLFVSKLDSKSKRQWEEKMASKDDGPKIDDFKNFLSDRCQLLESLDNSFDTKLEVKHTKKVPEMRSCHIVQKPFCVLCKNSHYIYTCKQFLDLSEKERLNQVRTLKLCSNCLRSGHEQPQCNSSGCKKCHKRHNTLLHQNSIQKQNNDENQITVLSHFIRKIDEPFTILSTALIYAYGASNKRVLCRVLLDSGSQSNFITQNMADRLGLSAQHINLQISGIDKMTTNITKRMSVEISPVQNEFRTKLSFLVLDKITDFTPQRTFNIKNLRIPHELKLADPAFNVSSDVDMLIGASLFYDLLLEGQIKLGKNLPILQKTKFGWIVSGNLPIQNNQPTALLNTNCFFQTSQLDQQIEKFWLTEEIPCTPLSQYSREERECEQHFIENVTRGSDGRFIVKLPLKDNRFDLGESEQQALRRFHSIEHKLSKNPELKGQYHTFLSEYEQLGHMTEITRDHISQSPVYYMPHHGVQKPESTSTKLRVVFDASAKTSSNLSLNDVLKVGPTIQSDLYSILIRFRKPKVVLVADLSKMYRQIWVHPDHRSFQRIIWRSEPNKEVRYYQLNTVTYGTASASFLATRCLNQIAYENVSRYPDLADIILRDFYMDDLLTGAEDIHSLNKIKETLSELLSEYGFELHKFYSNDSTGVINCDSRIAECSLVRSSNPSTKTLGISWLPLEDCFEYKTLRSDQIPDKINKRTILGFISRIFDPLGLLQAITIRGKLIIQRLWQMNLDWDQNLPPSMQAQWQDFLDQFSQVGQIHIPRHVFVSRPTNIQLHAFCDASEIAYAATIYVRCIDSRGNIQCRLLTAKAKVAPLKSLSIPRLELCGALLASRLLSKCLKIFDIPFNLVRVWTDSTIVLCWLARPPKTWKTFVANRVSEIHQSTEVDNWHHINSQNNPADIVSRGSSIDTLIRSNLWWHGPSFLSQVEDNWPRNTHISNFSQNSELFDLRPQIFVASREYDNSIFEKFSTLNKLVRITAYCLRFARNCKCSIENRIAGRLTFTELAQSNTVLLKLLQSHVFAHELSHLKKGRCVDTNSKLKSLNPFIDADLLIRVGGRLRHAELQYNQKFPIVLPAHHPYTDLVIWYEHHRHLHAGAQATLAATRQKYWIINGRNTVRRILRNCVTCFKVNPISLEQQMGELPKVRIVPSRPFSTVGVDYAGPFLVKDGKLRNRQLVKSYLVIFICFTTKAVHLELAGDLTTETFLNTLKRFVSRRGLCSRIYSDNATNFVGADRVLQRSLQGLSQDCKVENFLEENSISWQFIPAKSPNFGGIWEAAVKSAKYHLKRILGNAHLTFEALYTVITQVEAILNSRPITPLSSDPNDLSSLTPGHFLIGGALTNIPEPTMEDTAVTRLSHYQRLQQLVQHFWKRWSKEYLSSLQQRSKWQFPSSQPQIGSLVIVKEDHLPPLMWKLGRIVNVYPGVDGKVRVVDVKTAHGVFQRAISKVCLLPVETNL